VTTKRLRKRSDETAWTKAAPIVRDDAGRIASNVANALAALRHDPDLTGLFRFDQMQRAAVITGPIPGSPHDYGPYPRRVEDYQVTPVQEHLQRSGLPRIGKDTIYQAVEAVGREESFHPVRDYLGSMKWDGERRLDELLTYYFGAEPSTYHHEIGLMFLVSMVKRIFEPGCQADYALVLEGPQGSGKSSACKILGGAYFSDSLPTLRYGDKEPSAHLRGKWLIEIAELSAFKGADANALKSFISRREERFRPAFGRLEVCEPRQCVFIGTTNEKTYLSDPTGGRRFWPVVTGRIRLDELARDRDQLFAEALAHYTAGAQTYPDGDFEAKHIKPVQAARMDDDPWREDVEAYLSDRTSVLVGEVARDALKIDTPRLETRVQRRITDVLTAIGWHKSEKAINGYRPWLKHARPQLRVVTST
jgi:predicted P-loop ATPase